MAGSERQRKRAVRLTEDAAAALRVAIVEAWRQKGRAGKLTREARAEMLGLSISTTERVLKCQGVDRATLILAYRNLGLAWQESFVQAEEPEAPLEVNQKPVTVAPAWWSRLLTRPIMLAAAAVAMVLVVWPLTLSGRAEARNGPEYRATIELLDGSAAFHKGDYALAETKVNQSIETARYFKDPGSLAASLRMAGDIAAARGDFETARMRYSSSLVLRQVLKDRHCLPALYEALGDLETRTGDLDKAEGYLKKSLDMFTEFKDPVGVAMAARDLGTVAYLRSDMVHADEWFQKSADALAGQNKPDLETDVAARRALVSAQRGRIEVAQSALNKALDHWQAQKHTRWVAETKLQLATVTALSGDRDEAVKLAQASREGFISVKDAYGEKCAADFVNRELAVSLRH